MIPTYGPEAISSHLSIQALIPSAEQAFRAITDGTADSIVSILHPSDQADIHIKSAIQQGFPIFTVKMAGWSQTLVKRGEQGSSGMIVVFDSETCKPIAILHDNHLISDYRTAAKQPIIQSEWIKAGQHITSVGSDDASKCEIAPQAMSSSKIYVESNASGAAYGNPHRAIAQGAITPNDMIEIGDVIDNNNIRNHSETTIACLSGVGTQDLTAINQLWTQILRES